jgi:hypothetical protein
MTPTYADSLLSVTVRSPLPILDVSLDNLPHQLLEGQMVDCRVILRNTGGVSLRSLRAISNLPSFVKVVGDQIIPTAPTSPISMLNNIYINQAEDISLGETGTLEPGASLTVNVSCRGDFIGVHDLRWLFVFSGSVSYSSSLFIDCVQG